MSQYAQPLTVVNITSIAFSSSTWLNLLLGSNRQAFSVGEMKHILTAGKPICALHGDRCDFWRRFDSSVMNVVNPFLTIAGMCDRRFLIVNNSRKFLPYQQNGRIDSRFIHLVRDGRAVAASYLRKYPQMGMWSVTGRMSHDIRRNRRLIRRQPAGSTLLVRYEDLCRDREGELRRICRWLDMDYDASMAQFWKQSHHFIGGNPGTLGWVGANRDLQSNPGMTHRQLQSHIPGVGGWNVDFYRDKNPGSFLDERWKTELSPWQLRLFTLRAGWMNRSLGYTHEPVCPEGLTA